MSKASEHLLAHHTAMHADRIAAIENHEAALKKASAMEPDGGPQTAFHKAEIARHQKALAHHAAAMDECAKAAADSLEKGDRIRPDRISRIPDRNAPPEAYGSFRAIPRDGQPSPSFPVDPMFEKLIAVEEDE